MLEKMPMTLPLTNWAGNVTFSAERTHRPASVDELQRLIAASGHVRALGTGHSFNRIADSTGDLVSVAGLPRIMDIDTGRACVKVSAGLRYGELAAHLHRAGYALRNLASLPHLSVAGACATGSHGSGDANGSLSTAVSAMELVTAAGEIILVSRESAGGRFPGAVVGLGALGIVVSLTLDIVPTFDVRQFVYEDLPRQQVDDHLETILASAYSVSLFTDWRGPLVGQVWLKRQDGDPWVAPRRWLGARLADGPRHPVPGMSPAHCTQQLGVPGPWHERLPHFRPEFTPSSGQELQSEFLLPRRRAAEALAAIDRVRDRVAPVLQISEIRSVAADDLWLSPSYQRDSVGIHFTWVKDVAAVAGAVAAVEEQLAPLLARPHWGKVFGMSPLAVRGLYPRLPDFARLMRDYDPAGKFRNELIDRYITAGH
jgi:alditol oxidase